MVVILQHNLLRSTKTDNKLKVNLSIRELLDRLKYAASELGRLRIFFQILKYIRKEKNKVHYLD